MIQIITMDNTYNIADCVATMEELCIDTDDDCIVITHMPCHIDLFYIFIIFLAYLKYLYLYLFPPTCSFSGIDSNEEVPTGTISIAEVPMGVICKSDAYIRDGFK